MASFFTSPGDLVDWIKKEASSETEAAELVVNLPNVGANNVTSIRESLKRIYSNTDQGNAAEVLFRILASADITEDQAKDVAQRVGDVKTAEYLCEKKVITAEQKEKMVKHAQIMRQPGQYTMPLRYCPKLPKSVGNGLISTYNCRHYCLDGIVMDDDPERVYCGETLWRRHVMDKFSHEWKDQKTGKYVGGYINNRFYVMHDDGGNPLELAPGERTRKPRPHQWSTERRLQEAREKGSGQDLTIGKTAGAAGSTVKTAEVFVSDAESSVSASGQIIKTIKGVEFEIDWTLGLGASGMEHVEFEWPEGSLQMTDPASSDGSIVNPDTGEVLIDGLERETLEEQWEDEVFDAVYSKTASVAEKVLKQAGDENVVKLASNQDNINEKLMSVFSEAIDLRNNGMSDDDAALKLSSAHNLPVDKVVLIQSKAVEKMTRHAADVYTAENTTPAKDEEEINKDAEELGLLEKPTARDSIRKPE